VSRIDEQDQRQRPDLGEMRFRAERRLPPPTASRRQTQRRLLFAALLAGTAIVLALGVYEVNERSRQTGRAAGGEVTAPPAPAPVSVPSSDVVRRASPGVLHKCVAPDGAVSIQDQACPDAHVTEWARPYVPDVEATRRRAPARRPAAGRLPGVAAWDSRGSARDSEAERCAAAKRHEAAYRERRGLDITHAELRDLGDMVYDACKNT
jgi:hypothetical protein